MIADERSCNTAETLWLVSPLAGRRRALPEAGPPSRPSPGNCSTEVEPTAEEGALLSSLSDDGDGSDNSDEVMRTHAHRDPPSVSVPSV